MDENTPPSGYRHLSDVEVMKCLTFDKDGWTQRAIADELNCSQSTVNRILKEYDYKTFTQRRQHPGPARKTTKEDDRHLIIIVKRHYDLPFRDITNLSGLPISARTVARRCKEVELVSRYAQRKPFLTSIHKKARLKWALQYINNMVQDWAKVIFSDECLMKVGVNPRRRRVLRPPGKAIDERYLTPSFNSCRVTIMIWACFTSDRLGPLLTFEQGGIGSEEYQEVLYDGLLSLVDDLTAAPTDTDTNQVADENTLLFMHDNATCHKTPDVQRLLQENNIPVMKWPSRSPDLNPIENLWLELKKCFYLKWKETYTTPSSSSNSYDRYSIMIKECWLEIEGEFLKNLVESMPRRCAAVIKAKGGATGY